MTFQISSVKSCVLDTQSLGCVSKLIKTAAIGLCFFPGNARSNEEGNPVDGLEVDMLTAESGSHGSRRNPRSHSRIASLKSKAGSRDSVLNQKTWKLRSMRSLARLKKEEQGDSGTASTSGKGQGSQEQSATGNGKSLVKRRSPPMFSQHNREIPVQRVEPLRLEPLIAAPASPTPDLPEIHGVDDIRRIVCGSPIQDQHTRTALSYKLTKFLWEHYCNPLSPHDLREILLDGLAKNNFQEAAIVSCPIRGFYFLTPFDLEAFRSHLESMLYCDTLSHAMTVDLLAMAYLLSNSNKVVCPCPDTLGAVGRSYLSFGVKFLDTFTKLWVKYDGGQNFYFGLFKHAIEAHFLSLGVNLNFVL